MPPRFLLDENVPYEVGGWLRSRLPTARIDHVYDLGFDSEEDAFLFAWAETQEAVIVTFDEDFADQRRFPVGARCGVVRLRVEPTTEERPCEALERVLREIDPASFHGKLAIVDARRTRLIG